MNSPEIMAFTNELEKDAQWAAALRFVAKAGKGLKATKAMARGTQAFYRKGGPEAALEYLAKFRAPTHFVERGGIRAGQVLRAMPQQKGGATLSRGIRTGFGTAAANIQSLITGMRGKGALSGSFQFLRNISRTGAKQLRGAKFREVPMAKIKGGVLQGSGLFGKYKFFNRPVVGTTTRGTAIIKKRLAMRPLAYAVTAPGFALTTGITTKGTPTKRISAAAREGALWGISPIFGMASVLRGH